MNTNNNFNIGERIRQLRIKHGLTQEQLALRSNITTTYLGLLERNEKNPTIKIIEQLCNSLNLSLTDFFSSDNTSFVSEDLILLQIITQLSNRTEAEKMYSLQIIKAFLNFQDTQQKGTVKTGNNNSEDTPV